MLGSRNHRKEMDSRAFEHMESTELHVRKSTYLDRPCVFALVMYTYIGSVHSAPCPISSKAQ